MFAFDEISIVVSGRCKNGKSAVAREIHRALRKAGLSVNVQNVDISVDDNVQGKLIDQVARRTKDRAAADFVVVSLKEYATSSSEDGQLSFDEIF